jgi:cyclohexanecarboxylate-CoA ligase
VHSPVITPTRAIDASYRRPDVWEARTIASLLDERLATAPDALAIVDGSKALSYCDVATAVDALANSLVRAGVAPGSSVLVQLPNWWEALVAYHAIGRVGAVINPVIPIYRRAELAFIIQQSMPAAIVVPDEFRGFDHRSMIDDVLDGIGGEYAPARVVVRAERSTSAEWVRFDDLLRQSDLPASEPAGSLPESIALLLYTSGTTAAPKGVLHSHETLVYETRSIARWFSLGVRDHIFMGSPVTHITGFLYAYILPAMTGAAVALLDVWDPHTGADIIERLECRFTVAATPFLQGLSDEYLRRGQESALRSFACGGADVPPELVRTAGRALGAEVCRVYGSSEFPTFSCGRLGDPIDRRAETDGVAIGEAAGYIEGGVVGELLVRGPELFHGYLDASLNDASFTVDGYFRTGDLASIDDEGYVTIHGRIKDIILRNGENISAREVEDVLYTHPDIIDVAVVAVPDVRTGERACAAVVSSNRALGLADLQEFLRSAGLATQKWPEDLRLVAELPRTASGKVQKFLLREAFGAGQESKR